MKRPHPGTRARPISALLRGFALLGVAFGIATAVVTARAATNLAGPCANIEVKSEKFLHCVGEQIEAAAKTSGPARAVTDEPMKSYLIELSKTLGYQGSLADLAKLKQASIALKTDPVANIAPVTILDSAISAHAGEFRSILLPGTLPQDVAPAENVFDAYLQRKLDYFRSPAPQFYDRGPYAVLVRVQASVAFEEAYFLARATKTGGNQELADAFKYLREAIAYLSDPNNTFLPVAQKEALRSDYKFFNALLLYAMEDQSALIDALKDIISNNQPFDLATTKIDHVYLHKVYNRPYRIELQAGVDENGLRKTVVSETGLLRRVFNPAQLALFVCSLLQDGTRQWSIESLAVDIGNLALHDYYVVVSSANEKAPLERLSGEIAKAYPPERIQQPDDPLVKLISSNARQGFAEAMTRGAQICEISDQVRDEIFLPFQFKLRIQEIKSFGRFDHHLLLAGRLNFRQARALSNFLNETIFQQPALAALRKDNGLTNKAYVARMRVGG